jgi:lipopolysaccharide biosynthesis glycosyltransferase
MNQVVYEEPHSMTRKIEVPEHKIVVVASTDDNYALPLHIMFLSLLKNTQTPSDLALFVIDGGVQQTKKNVFCEEIEELGSSLQYIEVNKDLYANFPTVSHISAPAYYRISIPELFSNEVKRAIYLDCDLIIKGDITELWDINLEGHAIAAAENISSSTFVASGLKQEDYFNSGVIILDLEKWRIDNIPEKVRTFKLEHPELICTNDQCALNGVFRGRWKRLSIDWNMQSGLYSQSAQTKRLEVGDQFHNAVLSPKVIHYVGWAKPWLSPCFHPLEGEYRRYLDQSKNKQAHQDGEIPKHAQKHFKLFKKKLRQKRWQKKYIEAGYLLYP